MAAINKYNRAFRLVLAFLFVLVKGATFSQSKTPPLERLVTIKVSNTSVGDILKKMSEQGHFSFSYNTKSIDTDRKISLQLENKPVRTILHAIFRGSVVYKSKSNYIILSAVPKKEVEVNTEPKYLQVSGYAFDKPSSKKLKQVSIVEENTLLSTVSDNYGYFNLEVPNTTSQVKLKVNKEGYRDTVLVLTKEYFQAIEIILWPNPKEIELAPIPENLIAANDTTNVTTALIATPEKNKTFDFLLNSKMKSNLRNLRDTFFRKAQFSVIPPLSTNKLVGTHVMNNISLNLLAGYTGGVKYAEIAGLLNVDRGNVSYFQVAGLMNAVGGKTTGFQAAGLFNACRDDVTGFQAAGLCNINKKTTKGFQAAGLFNYSKHVKGVQAAGLFNYAKKINGVQISVFNFADTCNGVQIGFFNFVKHGYHKIELSADDVFYGNIAFRTGTERFHNIFTAGMGFEKYTRMWTFGYGIGTSFHLHKKLLLDIDITTSTIRREGAWPMLFDDGGIESLPDEQRLAVTNQLMNLNNKLYVGLDWQFCKHVGLSAGPTLNVHLTDTRNYSFDTFNSLHPNYFFSEMVDTNLKLNMWVGIKAAIRFL
ncbi:MAG TPA: STN domain-containing protein [Flavobacteriales bacterium]|nr:STN domain-containing protein [Flavobacteriales bacterium]